MAERRSPSPVPRARGAAASGGAAGAAGHVDPEAELDALRRRLYRPGAAETDVAAYRTAVASTRPDVRPEEGAVAAPERPALPARRTAAGAAVLVAAVGALLLPPILRQVQPAVPIPQPSSTARAPRQTFVPFTAADRLPVGEADRTIFRRALFQGEDAGLFDWLRRTPDGLVMLTGGRTASGLAEHSGRGSTTVELDPPFPEGGGRVTVLVVTASDAVVAWQVGRSADESVLSGQGRGSRQPAGSPMLATVRYERGREPLRLRITAPGSVPWGVAVLFPT